MKTPAEQESRRKRIRAAHLLQEAQQEVSGGGVAGEEPGERFLEDDGIEAAAGGRQRAQGPQDEARLLPRYGLLNLLHMLLDV